MTCHRPSCRLLPIALLLGAASLVRTARADDSTTPDGASNAPHSTKASPAPATTAPDRREPDQDEARRLYLEGTRQVEAGNCELAVAAYRRSFELFPSPSTLVNLAYCEGRLKRIVDAWLLLSRALALSASGAGPRLDPERQASAEAELRRLQARLPTLILQGPGSAELSIAGSEIVPANAQAGEYRLQPAATATWSSLPAGSRVYLEPGSYRVGQRSQGVATYQELALSEGTIYGLFVTAARESAPQQAVPLLSEQGSVAAQNPASPAKPTPPKPAHSRPYRTLGMAGLIAGGVAATGALIGAGLLVATGSELAERCAADGTCPVEVEAAVSRYQTAAVLTNVSLIAGFTATALGVGLLVTDRITVQASASGGELRVRF